MTVTSGGVTMTHKTEGQQILDRVYQYLIVPMCGQTPPLPLPYYLKGAQRWNGTVAALSLIARVAYGKQS